ncbi:DUF488 family protein [Enterococcus saccharolyticus]|uniref:DUF488 domain-containing protein n=1 Tax=Candidatus Enterococcus willemsii TaxID=1857215 RepID=A0ABQ6YYV2_9ENTE|nr:MULTISPECIES: DUF488 family protein [Enterococcus]KAF1302860.1 hypothetical protein BAU17_11640 [Enterococcus sp. CU12B]MCD5000991.1 DUF488 family protein [Enterococcus saccharolyticus]
MGKLKIKRAYEEMTPEDGKRILVDRVWPRGIKKETLHLDLWAKDIAPTKELRQQFNHQVEKFSWFQTNYRTELAANSSVTAFIQQISEWLQTENVTLIYSAKDTQHNQAVVLAQFLKEELAIC